MPSMWLKCSVPSPSPPPASPFCSFLLPGCLLLCYGLVDLTPTVPEAFALLVFKSHPEQLTGVYSCTWYCFTQTQLPTEERKASNWPWHLIQPFRPRTKGNSTIFWDKDRMLLWCVLPSKHKPTAEGLCWWRRSCGHPSCTQPLGQRAGTKHVPGSSGQAEPCQQLWSHRASSLAHIWPLTGTWLSSPPSLA